MKKVLLPCLLLLFFFGGCKKKKTSDPVDNSYTVEYRIDPMNVYFTKITYNDENGNPVVLTDYTLFVDGKRSIKVTTKPFNAAIDVEINNTTNAVIYYSLQIWVNGEIKGYKSTSVPPQTTYTASLSYTVPQ